MLIMEKDPSLLRLKITVMGDTGVGKSSLLMMYARGNLEHISRAIPTSCTLKNMVIDDKEIQLEIWDTVAEVEIRPKIKPCFHDSHGVVIVYDVSDRNTFVRVDNWLKQVQRLISKPVVIVVGNKMDRVDRSVPRSEGLQYSKDKGILFMENSVLLRHGIGYMFEKLVRKILQERVSERREQGNRLKNLSSCSYL